MDPVNGEVSWNGLSPGSVATYTCDDGHVLEGNSTRVCMDDRQWSGEPPICRRM